MSSQKRHSKRRKKNLRQLEPLFRGVKEALIHDLSDDYMSRICYGRKRGEDVPINTGCPPYTFKKFAQLLNFDKRVIWGTDKSFEVLSAEAFKGFVESQQTFICPEPMSLRATRVIQEASRLCHKILGVFDEDEWLDSCSFGKRAAVGLPRSQSYLDVRFERISGTPKQRAAFNQCLARDVHLLRAVRKRSRIRPNCDVIRATAVPKSFKAARVIAPDTVLGGFLSRGLGDLIRRRLEKETHIDLSKQQDRHRRWAQVASKNGHLSTIDMSKASDSFTWRHIELLVPISWHEALDAVRTRHCEVLDSTIELNSYMLMGSGHTFPLQTLLFYCLAEATRLLLKSRGKVSVYGDDIIVPTRISRQLIVVMSELGFTINSEKSFYDKPDPERPSHTFFRESCGGDYKGGIDVRPYMPECDLQSDGVVPRNVKLAWCHKMINGLLDRWDSCEIPVTLSYLLREIHSEMGRISLVPSWEVDHAGIRHHIPSYLTLGMEVSDITYEASFPAYYRLVYNTPIRKRATDERPYVWYSYYLANNETPARKTLTLWDLLDEENREAKVKDYDQPILLSGENRKDVKGCYRWKKQGPRPLKARKGQKRLKTKQGITAI